jgi:hypothetical protein
VFSLGAGPCVTARLARTGRDVAARPRTHPIDLHNADLLVVDGELETDINALLRPHAVLLQGVTIGL